MIMIIISEVVVIMINIDNENEMILICNDN